MPIQPTPSGSSSRLGRLAPQSPLETARTGNPAAGSSGAEAGDRAEISSVAHELSGANATESVPAGVMDPARMRQVLDRVGSGFYESTDVRDSVVRLIARAL